MKKWLRRLAVGSLVVLILFTGITFLRLQLARYQINKDRQAFSNAASLDIGETSSLEILPLYENNGLPGLQTGHGVAYLIRTDDTTILFDLGNNMMAESPSPLLQNMRELGISVDDINEIVISHRHPDHLGGQNWWSELTFSLDGLTQPSLGSMPIYIPEETTYPGSTPILSKMPALLSNSVATTGVISYAQPFPIWLVTPKGDEQALAVNVSGVGIILITGCGHMGLESLIDRGEKVFDVPIVGVIGGLHYGNADTASLQPHIQLLNGLNPVIVALSPHDSDQAVLDDFAQAFPEAYAAISVGQPIHLSATSAATDLGERIPGL